MTQPVRARQAKGRGAAARTAPLAVLPAPAQPAVAQSGEPATVAGRALLDDVETYRVFSTSGRAEGVNLLDPWEAIRRRLAGPEGILAIEAEAADSRALGLPEKEKDMDLETLRALSEAASPGSWTRETIGNATLRSAAGRVTRDLYAVAPGESKELRDTFHDLTYIVSADGSKSIALTGNGPKQIANAEFIAAAVEYVRARLAAQGNRPEGAAQ
jgi:hypothetical protein